MILEALLTERATYPKIAARFAVSHHTVHAIWIKYRKDHPGRTPARRKWGQEPNHCLCGKEISQDAKSCIACVGKVTAVRLKNRDGKDELIATALRKSAGQNWQAIADQCHCSFDRVQRVCTRLGLKPKRGGAMNKLKPEEYVAAGISGSHTKWHVKRGIVNPKCPLCSPEESKATGAAAGK